MIHSVIKVFVEWKIKLEVEYPAKYYHRDWYIDMVWLIKPIRRPGNVSRNIKQDKTKILEEIDTELNE
jgi:hypothetical protein